MKNAVDDGDPRAAGVSPDTAAPTPDGNAKAAPARRTAWMDWKRSLARLAVLGAVAYLTMVSCLVVSETSLVYPRPQAERSNWQPPGIEYEPVHFRAEDGTDLFGWYLDHPQPKGHLVFFHGNASQVPDIAFEMDALRRRLDVAVLLFDYRGYGYSEGSPSEAGVIADGLAAQAWLSQRAHIPPQEMILFGRSLGGGVAVAIAAQTGARGLVLDRTFHSMVDVAAQRYPFVPVKLLMRNRFPSVQRIAEYHGPLLQLHGQVDRVVPFASGKQLFLASPSSQKRFFPYPHLDHFAPMPEPFVAAIDRLLAAEPPLAIRGEATPAMVAPASE